MEEHTVVSQTVWVHWLSIDFGIFLHQIGICKGKGPRKPWGHNIFTIPLFSVTGIQDRRKNQFTTGCQVEPLKSATSNRSTYLVCLLPLSSCWATEAHFSASCVTKRRWRKRSLSGNFFISDSSIKALKLTRPNNKQKAIFSVISMFIRVVWNTEEGFAFISYLKYLWCFKTLTDLSISFLFFGWR